MMKMNETKKKELWCWSAKIKRAEDEFLEECERLKLQYFKRNDPPLFITPTHPSPLHLLMPPSNTNWCYVLTLPMPSDDTTAGPH